MEIEIVPITWADVDDVFSFLREHFYADEPVRTGLKLGPPPIIQGSATLIKYNCSFKAVLKHDPSLICGVVINEEINQQTVKEKWVEQSKQYPGETMGTFFEFLNFAYNEFLKSVDAKCWTPTQANSALEIAAISTHRAYRGQNIAGRLLERTEELARSKGHRWLCIECTSAYSAALAKKHGYHTIYQLPYNDYRDKNGVAAVKAYEPHMMLQGLAKDLNNNT